VGSTLTEASSEDWYRGRIGHGVRKGEAMNAEGCRVAWRRHRIVEGLLWLLIGAEVLLVAAITTHVVATRFSLRVYLFEGGYLLLVLVLGVIHGRFCCPRCGYRFNAWGPDGGGHNSLARVCRHCHLHKWQCDG